MTDAILFMGWPGTLKTFLSSRIAARAGLIYLPTAAAGPLRPDAERGAARVERYRTLGRILSSLLDAGGRVVVDGGFLSAEVRGELLAHVPPESAIIVHCSATERDLAARLRRRSTDPFDHESGSAASILATGADPQIEAPPSIDLAKGRVAAALLVDTSSCSARWIGEPPADLNEYLPNLVVELLSEYADMTDGIRISRVRHHFDEFASDYDHRTEWREHADLLSEMYRPVGVGSRILDVGAGSGLAAQRYFQEGGTVVSLDPSESMLRLAWPRSTVGVIGVAEEMPFLAGYFDRVVLRQVLQYSDPVPTVAEVARVLKPGASACLAQTVSRSEAARRLWERFTAQSQPLRDRVLTTDDLVGWAVDAGLRMSDQTALVLRRNDSLEALAARGNAPEEGWTRFLSQFCEEARQVDPQLDFEVVGNRVSYAQLWSVTWVVKP